MTINDAIALNWKLDDIVRRVRREVIMHVLKEEKGHQIRTAARLGMHRNTLARYIKELNIPTLGYCWKRKDAA